LYPLGDVFGDMKDMMTGVKGTTGAETTKNGIKNERG
jgi:hypothetical protein